LKLLEFQGFFFFSSRLLDRILFHTIS